MCLSITSSISLVLPTHLANCRARFGLLDAWRQRKKVEALFAELGKGFSPSVCHGLVDLTGSRSTSE
jgi:hypothetical protein